MKDVVLLILNMLYLLGVTGSGYLICPPDRTSREDKAIQMPPVKKEKKLPTVLSRQECKVLFKAPGNLKHRFLLAFAYAGGHRMNELRMIKISDVDMQREQMHIRHSLPRP
jgi:site-specific recombinase XerD